MGAAAGADGTGVAAATVPPPRRSSIDSPSDAIRLSTTDPANALELPRLVPPRGVILGVLIGCLGSVHVRKLPRQRV